MEQNRTTDAFHTMLTDIKEKKFANKNSSSESNKERGVSKNSQQNQYVTPNINIKVKEAASKTREYLEM
jgi:hypothetical protein